MICSWCQKELDLNISYVTPIFDWKTQQYRKDYIWTVAVCKECYKPTIIFNKEPKETR